MYSIRHRLCCRAGRIAANGPQRPLQALEPAVKVQETIYHPGHYRVALAVNSRNELPPDPMTFERMHARGAVFGVGGDSEPAADSGHRRRPVPALHAAGDRSRRREPMTCEADIELPNINCAKCTLQVIQFMADHGYNQPGGYSYHHCADLQITADPAKPIDKGWPVGK